MSRTARSSNERGLTLVEIMVVIALAGVVTLGLVGFYLTSQATWIDASSKTMAQRDATTLLETITHAAREAGKAVVLPVADSTNCELILYDKDLVEMGRFTWNSDDSLVHRGLGNTDKGPVVSSHAERFQLATDNALPILYINRIQLRGANGQLVSLRSSVKLYNAP
jgi:prepilin-type N-terminal cleavage/methylation domain-containing protein